jgi:hypothetical protein
MGHGCGPQRNTAQYLLTHLRFGAKLVLSERAMKRILLIVLLTIALMIASAWLAIRAYLSSSRMNEQVVTKLETFYGNSARFGQVRSK